MKLLLKSAAQMAFLTVLLWTCACNITVKFPPLNPKPVNLDANAIFQDDFPFEISKQTPDPGTVIPPTRSGSVILLPAGQHNFEMKYRLLQNASSVIKLQSYILYRDPVALNLVKIVEGKQKQGVNVKFIADCYTKYITKEQIFYFDMVMQGVDLLGFEPLYFSASEDPNALIDVNDINMRFHEKYWLVDDYVGITGGTNIAQEYASYQNDPRFLWRDQDVILTGEVVKDMSRAFDENYVYFTKKRMNRPDPINPWFYKKECDKHKKAKSTTVKNPAGNEAPIDQILQAEGFTDVNVPVRFIRSRPRLKETYIHQAYVHLFNTAKKSILIENSYILLDESLSKALIAAARRGVEITIVTNCEKTNDVFEMAPLTRATYLPLLEAGIKIYEWQGIVPGKGSVHAKYAVFDEDISIVGSYNLDPRSTFLNSEDIVVIRSQKTADELKRYTREIDLKYSKPVTIEMAKKFQDQRRISQIWTRFALSFKDWW